MKRAHWLTVLLTAALAGCGGSGGGYGTNPGTTTGGNTGGGNPAPTPGGNTVTLVDNSFTPSVLNVAVGTTVAWKWAACTGDGYSACPTHSVTFDDGSNLASAVQDSGEYDRTFTAAGTYKYHCSIHGSGMSGEIVVK